MQLTSTPPVHIRKRLKLKSMMRNQTMIVINPSKIMYTAMIYHLKQEHKMEDNCAKGSWIAEL